MAMEKEAKLRRELRVKQLETQVIAAIAIATAPIAVIYDNGSSYAEKVVNIRGQYNLWDSP